MVDMWYPMAKIKLCVCGICVKCVRAKNLSPSKINTTAFVDLTTGAIPHFHHSSKWSAFIQVFALHQAADKGPPQGLQCDDIQWPYCLPYSYTMPLQSCVNHGFSVYILWFGWWSDSCKVSPLLLLSRINSYYYVPDLVPWRPHSSSAWPVEDNANHIWPLSSRRRAPSWRPPACLRSWR